MMKPLHEILRATEGRYPSREEREQLLAFARELPSRLQTAEEVESSEADILADVVGVLREQAFRGTRKTLPGGLGALRARRGFRVALRCAGHARQRPPDISTTRPLFTCEVLNPVGLQPDAAIRRDCFLRTDRPVPPAPLCRQGLLASWSHFCSETIEGARRLPRTAGRGCLTTPILTRDGPPHGSLEPDFVPPPPRNPTTLRGRVFAC